VRCAWACEPVDLWTRGPVDCAGAGGQPRPRGVHGEEDWQEGAPAHSALNVRQDKPGRRGKEVATLKLREATLGENPTRDGRKAIHVGSESCVTVGSNGRPWSRSVDSGCMGREVGPRNVDVVGAETPFNVEGDIDASCEENRHGLSASIPPGSESSARTQGLPRNLGGLDVPDHRNGPARESEPGRASRRRSTAVRATTWGNPAEGPRRAKGGAAEQNRWRER
jgi:hypothetical protein